VLDPKVLVQLYDGIELRHHQVPHGGLLAVRLQLLELVGVYACGDVVGAEQQREEKELQGDECVEVRVGELHVAQDIGPNEGHGETSRREGHVDSRGEAQAGGVKCASVANPAVDDPHEEQQHGIHADVVFLPTGDGAPLA